MKPFCYLVVMFGLFASAVFAEAPLPSPVRSQADIDSHLADLERSPLRYLSEPGRAYFLDSLTFHDGNAFFSFLPLTVELASAEAAEIHRMLGRGESVDQVSEDSTNIARRASLDTVQRFYRHRRTVDRLVRSTENLRAPDFLNEMHRALRKEFGAMLGSPAGIATPDLLFLAEAVHATFFHTTDVSLVRLLEQLADELNARGDHPRLAALNQRAYSDLLVAREIERANAFAKRHGVEPVEWKLTEQSGIADEPAVIALDEGGEALRVHQAELGTGLVASVSPGCAFSVAAMKFIEQDAELRELLEGRALWVVDPRWTSQLKPLLEWNAQSELDMQLAWKTADWPAEMDFSATPMFYLIDGGEVIETIRGWEDDGKAELLKAKLKALLD